MAADLAIGISKVAVEALVNKVKSAMKEEAEQWQIVQNDVVFITDELETMQSFLNSANREGVKTDVMATRMRQVRDLSYDFEDCIEFIFHLDTEKRGSWWLRFLPSCSCSNEEVARPVDEAVTKIKQLKTRVEEVSQRNIRYSRFIIDDSGSRSLTPQQFAPGFATGAPGFHILAEARDTAARFKGVVDLTKLITMGSSTSSNADLQVISVWGAGHDDFGATSIIRNMYDDPRTCKEFKYRAWVKVMHPFNIPEFIRSLVIQFYANSCQEEEGTIGIDALSWAWLLLRRLKKRRDALSWTETTADLVREFVRHINTERYLIILEDISTMVQWDAIRLCLRGKKNAGSRVVVSTRHHEIASLCTGEQYRVLELQRHSVDQSICVFFSELQGFNYADIVATREDEDLLQNSKLVGRDWDVYKIFNLVKCKPYTDKPHVVSVWGIPGSGRTAVVTSVCSRNFENMGFVCWNTYSMVRPYNLMGFCRRVVSGSNLASTEPQDPIEQCRRLLKNNRCLIVIDEMQSKEGWDLINDANLISAESESCIVVVTTEESVAIHCAAADDLAYNVICLQATAAFDLFQQAYLEACQNKRNLLDKKRIQNNGNSIEEEPSQNNVEQRIKYIFEEAQTHQNNVNLWEGEPSQNSGNSVKEDAFTKPLEEPAFQSNGNSFEEQTIEHSESSLKEEVNPFEQAFRFLHAFDSNGFSFEKPDYEVRSQNGENSSEERSLHSSGNSFDNGKSFYEGGEQSNLLDELALGNDEQIFQSNGKPFDEDGGESLSREEQTHHNNEVISMSRNNPNVEAILSRSGGIPQVIVALGKYLAKPDQSSNTGIWERQCQRLIANFMQELQTDTQLRGLFTWMHSQFSSCPDPSLKLCMLYLLIFPRGQTFRRSRLVRRWIAEGYTKDTESNNRLDEYACELFNKLVASQSVTMQEQATQSTLKTRYEVNGFFHEYMISRPKEEKIFFPLQVSVLEEGYSRQTTTRGVGQHLAIWSSWERKNRVVFDSLDLSRLRSFTVFGRWEPFFISNKMRVLRVLDLEDAQDVTNEHVSQIAKVLFRLKFLSLRGCKGITILPDSMCGLSQLQTLDIRDTYVDTLPLCLTKLQMLQYVRAGTTGPMLDDHTSAVESLLPRPPPPVAAEEASAPLLSSIPPAAASVASAPSSSVSVARKMSRTHAATDLMSSWFCFPGSRSNKHPDQLRDSGNGGVKVELVGIGKMVNLHSLGVIDVSVASGQAIWKELKSMTQLRKLGVSGLNPENINELCSAISCHEHLTKLHLHMTRVPQQEIEALGDLPKLTTLCLCFEESGHAELQLQRGFKVLQVLKIALNCSLHCTFHSGVMCNLEILKLHCRGVPSSLQFSGLEMLHNLKEVLLSGSYDDALKQKLQSQLDHHPRKTKPVLKV